MPKYDNSERLSAVLDQDWCEALDELTTYLKWRLKGRTKWGAHSEKVLGLKNGGTGTCFTNNRSQQ